jgi:hypothetical protein
LTFHPNDPLAVVAELEIGDGSEIQHLMDIEEAFQLADHRSELSDLVWREGATFGELVEFLVRRSRT